MAGRLWLPPLGHLEVDVASLFGSVTFGATGAVASFTGKGVAGVTRNSAGHYTVALTDDFNALMWVGLTRAGTAPAATDGSYARYVSNTIGSGTPTIVVEYDVAAGTAADPVSGAVLLFRFDLRNSSVT